VGGVGRTPGALNANTLAIVDKLEAAAEGERWLIESTVARSAGLSASTIAALRASDRWSVLAKGVNAVEGRDGGPFQQLDAELRTAGAVAFARRLAAAAVHESVHRNWGQRERPDALDVVWDGDVDIGVARGGSSRRTRIRVPKQHVVVVDGLRCTDGLLTLLELAAVLDAVRWEHALEATLRYRLTTVEEIRTALSAPGRRNLAAVALVESVLAVRPPDAPATGSLIETLFIQLARTHGLPTPERQHCIQISPTKRYFVDVARPRQRFFIELDGSHHERQRLHDADRLAAIVARTSWTYITLTWHQVVSTPSHTARRVAAILAARPAA
jgi:very-short-patch-repair endonuclease